MQSTIKSLAAEMRQAGRVTANAVEAKEDAAWRVAKAAEEHEQAQRRLQEPQVTAGTDPVCRGHHTKARPGTAMAVVVIKAYLALIEAAGAS